MSFTINVHPEMTPFLPWSPHPVLLETIHELNDQITEERARDVLIRSASRRRLYRLGLLPNPRPKFCRSFCDHGRCNRRKFRWLCTYLCWHDQQPPTYELPPSLARPFRDDEPWQDPSTQTRPVRIYKTPHG